MTFHIVVSENSSVSLVKCLGQRKYRPGHGSSNRRLGHLFVSYEKKLLRWQRSFGCRWLSLITWLLGWLSTTVGLTLPSTKQAIFNLLISHRCVELSVRVLWASSSCASSWLMPSQRPKFHPGSSKQPLFEAYLCNQSLDKVQTPRSCIYTRLTPHQKSLSSLMTSMAIC